MLYMSSEASKDRRRPKRRGICYCILARRLVAGAAAAGCCTLAGGPLLPLHILCKGEVLVSAAGGGAGGMHGSALAAGCRQLCLDKAAAALQVLLPQQYIGRGLF